MPLETNFLGPHVKFKFKPHNENLSGSNKSNISFQSCLFSHKHFKLMQDGREKKYNKMSRTSLTFNLNNLVCVFYLYYTHKALYTTGGFLVMTI